MSEHSELAEAIWNIATTAAREQFGARVNRLEQEMSALQEDMALVRDALTEARYAVDKIADGKELTAYLGAVPEPQSLRA